MEMAAKDEAAIVHTDKLHWGLDCLAYIIDFLINFVPIPSLLTSSTTPMVAIYIPDISKQDKKLLLSRFLRMIPYLF